MTTKLETLEAAVRNALGDDLQSLTVAFGEITIVVKASNYLSAMRVLRDHADTRFEELIDLCGVDVHITVAGRAEGPAVGVLAVGHLRRATEHARLRLKDPSIELTGSATALAELARAELERLDRFHERLATAVVPDLELVKADCAAGRYLSATEAVSYGLVDEIVRRPGTIHEFPRRLGFRP